MKTKRAIRWVFWNGLVALLAWLAAIKEVEGAERLMAFLLWFFGVAQLLAGLLATKEMVADFMNKGGFVIPQWISFAYSAGLITFLVWHDYQWSAVAALMCSIGTGLFRVKAEQLKVESPSIPAKP